MMTMRRIFLFLLLVPSLLLAGGKQKMTITAHAGAYVTPDNTMLSVRTALALHPDLIEIDVRHRPDGSLAISHDEIKSASIDKQQHEMIIKNVKIYSINLDREILYERINKRVDQMIKGGLVDEVRNLLKVYSKDLRSLQAIGYKELIPVIMEDANLETAIELIKQHTRNYAKRQMTFIRHQFNVTYYKNNEDLWREING